MKVRISSDLQGLREVGAQSQQLSQAAFCRTARGKRAAPAELGRRRSRADRRSCASELLEKMLRDPVRTRARRPRLLEGGIRSPARLSASIESLTRTINKALSRYLGRVSERPMRASGRPTKPSSASWRGWRRSTGAKKMTA